MKVFKRSKAYGAFEYAVIIALVIVAALIILKIVKGKTNPTFLDTSKAAVDNYIAESTTKIEESVPDTSGIVVDFSEFRYTTTSAENVAADILAALKVSNLAKDKNNVDISDSLEIVQGADTLHGVGKRTIKLRATDEYSNTKDFFKTIILTQTINDDFLSNYLKAVITEMGAKFSSEEDFNTFVIDFLNDDIEGEPIKDILKAELLEKIEKAEINKDINTLQEGSEPRQIAISVSDPYSVIDNIFNKLKNKVKTEPDIITTDLEKFNALKSKANELGIKEYMVYKDNLNYFYLFGVQSYYYNLNYRLNYLYHPAHSENVYAATKNNDLNSMVESTYLYIGNDFPIIRQYSSYYIQEKFVKNFLIFENNEIKITLPKGDFIKSWSSPYTCMQTVTIPIPSETNMILTYTEPLEFTYKTY